MDSAYTVSTKGHTRCEQAPLTWITVVVSHWSFSIQGLTSRRSEDTDLTVKLWYLRFKTRAFLGMHKVT